MESNSNRIKLFTSNVLERVTSFKKYIGIVILIIIIIFIGYYLSYNVRTNKKVQEVLMNHKSNIRYQTNYCHENYRSYSLVDFHVKSSFNPVATGYRKFDYLSLDMLYQVLRLGTRYLEFEIFSKEQNNDSIPVISIGSKLGDWKMTANVLECKEVFELIAVNAFSQKLLENYRDPLFLFLNLKTDNITVLNKLADIIESTFKINLLDKTYQFQRKNLAESLVCDLLDKVVIMSSSGYHNSKLEKIINISTDSPSLERLSYSDLVIQKKFNVNQPDFILKSNKISFHKGITNDYLEIHDYNLNLREMNLTKNMKIKIGNTRILKNSTGEHLLSIDNITDKKISFKKHDNISFVREQLGSNVIIQGYIINEAAKNIEAINTTRLTIVVPDFDLFSANFNPKNIWFTGTQFVAMNFQTMDENIDMYLKFFEKRAIKLKQSSLLNKSKGLKNTNFPTNKVVIDKERKFNSDCEELDNTNYLQTTSVQNSNKDGIDLSEYDTELKIDKKYNINYDFLKKNLSLDVFFQPKFNPALRLIKDHLGNLRMSLSHENNNFIFQVVSTNNKKIPNSVRIIRGDNFLVVNKNKKLGFEKPTNETLNDKQFLAKSTFLILNPACEKENMCSIGHVTYEKTGNNLRESTPVLNYLKVNTTFSTNNRIYKFEQTKYRKILSLKGYTNNTNGNSEEIGDYTIWRPFKRDNFYPVGDVIFEGNKIPLTDSKDPTSIVSTKIVDGAVKHPVSYELFMKYSDSDNDSYVIWKPIAPDGFISMGYVTVKNGGDTPPSKKEIVCVGANFVKPAEIFTEVSSDVSNEFSKYNRQYFNKKLSFWKGKNINYFTPYKTKINTFSGNRFVLEPPIEFDYPIFEFQNLDNFTDDLVMLDSNLSKVSDREAACFKYTVTYKSGEFTEYKLYNGLDEMPDRDGKIVSFIRNRNNGNMCVSLPNSYWSSHYKEISSISDDDNVEDLNSINGDYNYMSKIDKCSKEARILSATLYATEENCSKIGGYMDNQNKFKASISPDKTAKCLVDICNEKSVDSIYMNKANSCKDGNVLGKAKIETTYKDCMDMGGEYIGNIEDRNKIVKCGIDICKKPSKFSYKIPRDNQKKGDYSRATFKSEFVPGEQFKSFKCSGIHSDAQTVDNFCEIPIYYSAATENVELNMASCRDRNYFGTSFNHMDDNTIRLRDNKDYCLTVPLDNNDNPIITRKSELNNNEKDNNINLSTCKSSRLGQQFNKDRNNNIRYVSNTEGITDFCLTSEYDSSLRLNKCNPALARQKWIFNNMPNDYCIGEGSIVYYFKKISRDKKGPSRNNVLNLPVENLLQEEFDFNHFHLYVRGIVTKIDNNIIHVKDIENNSTNKFNRESQLDELVLEYTPPVEKLELGTKVIATNGAFLKVDDIGNSIVSYKEQNVKWYGVVTEKLKSGNYKVFFSINSIEPDQRNKKCARPDYSMVKEVSLSDLYLLRNASIC